MTIRDIAISFGYEINKASEKKANDSIQSLKSTASKLLGAIAVVFSVKGLASLAEAAASVEALESQFSQVFGDIEDRAAQALKSIGDETGVLTGRMKSSFSQIAAFAKASGMDTEGALDLTERAMRAVADSAAFYDRSIEDVTNSLQSFLKGNFNNDAALGLSATETTRNAAANALYGKSFIDLAEDQKQLTLLKMVEDANVLSGALGQAARESDTWGNQLGNLKQSIKDLRAALGKSFLKPAIQVLKLASLLVTTLTDGINELTGEGRLLNRMFERMTNRIKRTQDFVEGLVNKLGGAERAIKLLSIVAGSLLLAFNAGKIITFIKAVSHGIGGVNKKMLLVAAVIIVIALLVEDLINFMQGNDSLMGRLFEKFGIDGEQVRETIRGILDAAKALLPFIADVAKQFGGFMVKALKQLLPLLLQLLKKLLPPLLDSFKRTGKILMDAGKKIIPTIFRVIERIIPLLMSINEMILPVVIGLVERLLPFLVQLVEAVLPVILGLIESLLPLLFQVTETILPVIFDLINALLPLVFQIVDTVLPLIINLIETVLPLVMQIIDVVLPIIIELLTAVLPILMEIVSTVLPVIVELITAILPLVFQIIEAILPVILELITAILPILTPIIKLVADLVSALLPPIISLLTAILPILEPILGILKPISEILGVIIETIAKVIDWVAKGFSWVIDIFTGGGKNKEENSSSTNDVQSHAKGTSHTADTFIAGEEGPELITGARGRKVFTNAATGNIFQTLRDIAMMGIRPRAETVAASTSSVENKSIVQNNQFTNQFYGDRAGQQKSAAAMEKSTDDATGILSRGLAYVR